MNILNTHLCDIENSLSRFSDKLLQLDDLNKLANSITLKAVNTQHLHKLNQNSHVHHSTYMDTYKKIQTKLLQSLTFQQKCEKWMSFLREIDHQVSDEPGENYTVLMEQNRAIEVESYNAHAI